MNNIFIILGKDINNEPKLPKDAYHIKTKDMPNELTILSGNKDIDILVHRILDNIMNEFIESWYKNISNNKDFPYNSRAVIEDIIINFSKRINVAPLLPLITTKLIDDIANHTKIYRKTVLTIRQSESANKNQNLKVNPQHHKRNKSETDLTWNLGNANVHKNVANSTFYSVQSTDESLLDPEKRLIKTFFDNCQDSFKNECLDELELEKHLKCVMETVLYYTLSKEDFACDTLRTLLSSLLANVVCKHMINMLSDADFINLQLARKCPNDIDAGSSLVKMINECNDYSELRAVRQFIIREMDLKYNESKSSKELTSLKFTQELIDKRISKIQNNQNNPQEKHLFASKLPLMSLDDILSKDIALSYYLDYLSILNLQKYVIFYLMAQDWKLTAQDRLAESLDAFEKSQLQRQIRDKAFHLYKEYLLPASNNYLNIDQGLIEVLHIKIKDTFIMPEMSWFESICKFIYEKLKNEDVFLNNFYQSSAYKKLLLELEEIELLEPPTLSIGSDYKTSDNPESESDSISGDFLIDEIDLLDINEECEDEIKNKTLLDPNKFRHQRSHSDTGVINFNRQPLPASSEIVPKETNKKLAAIIINTAINSEGHFAVYAINVTVIDELEHKSWHIYRRYSKFLELKKILIRKFPQFLKVPLPFPKKQTFHNTDRNVLERRMSILNEFLSVICDKAEQSDLINATIREFLEPDHDDKKIHGTKVIRHLVRPLKSGIKTIKSMPDTFMDGISQMFVGKTPDEKSSSYESDDVDHIANLPLDSLLKFVDVVFDYKSRSQWRKRGMSGLLGAPWVSQTANRKILEAAQKHILNVDKIEDVLCALLDNVWPNGVRQDPIQREDNTKLRTRMMAKVSLFALLSGLFNNQIKLIEIIKSPS